MGTTGRRGRGAGVAALVVCLALVVPLVPSGAAASSTQFLPYRAIPVASGGDAVAVGDVTGDGRADVVLTTGYANDARTDFHLAVLPQLADGTLAAPTWYATAATYPNRPTSVAIGDLTGDGLADVAVGVAGTGVQVFPQTGDGLLGTPTLAPSPDSLRVRIGQLDGDGRPDVAGIGWGTDTVTVFSDPGSGLVAARTLAVQHDGYDDLEVGDVSGDGLDDIVVMSGQGLVPNLSVLAQVTGSGFAPAAEYSVAPGVLTHGIGLGDVTGDARADVVASYGGNRPASSIAALPQMASGALGAPVSRPAYDMPEPVEVADVDRDGRPDVVTLHGGWQRAGVYPALAGGSLASEELFAIPYASHYNPHGLAVGDVTGDGWPDLAIADSSVGLVVLPNAGDQAPPSPSPTPTALPTPSPTPTPTPTPSPKPTPTPTPVQPPSAPTALATTPNLAAGIGLTWAPPASSGTSPITSYRIYRGNASGTETPLVTVGNVVAFTDAAVANGSTYWYQVAAVSAAGEGPRSAETIAQRGTAPGAPTALTATAGKGSIGLKWTASSSTGGSAITGYRIYRGTASGRETFLAAVAPTARSYTDAGLDRKVRYWYRITAENVLGESVASAEASATPR